VGIPIGSADGLTKGWNSRQLYYTR